MKFHITDFSHKKSQKYISDEITTDINNMKCTFLLLLLPFPPFTIMPKLIQG